jgi:hypothetical protein
MDREGRPHTNQLHTLEKFTRTNFDTLRYELTVDDPGAYTRSGAAPRTCGGNQGRNCSSTSVSSRTTPAASWSEHTRKSIARLSPFPDEL